MRLQLALRAYGNKGFFAQKSAMEEVAIAPDSVKQFVK